MNTLPKTVDFENHKLKFKKTELEYESFPTLPCKELEGGVSIFKVMAIK